MKHTKVINSWLVCIWCVMIIIASCIVLTGFEKEDNISNTTSKEEKSLNKIEFNKDIDLPILEFEVEEIENDSEIEDVETEEEIIEIENSYEDEIYIYDDEKVTEYSYEEEIVQESEEIVYDRSETTSAYLYSPSDFKVLGVIYWNNYKWTWYSEKVLAGGGLDIPGRCIDENGYVCDEYGYICLASGSLTKGTVVPTPFGKDGKIYDYCETYGVIDVYVSW